MGRRKEYIDFGKMDEMDEEKRTRRLAADGIEGEVEKKYGVRTAV